MTISRRLDALEAKPTAHLATDRPVPANVIEFATGPAFLGLRLYPRQATLVKLLCLALELLTPYDLEVIVGWAAGFTAIDHIDGRRWSGISGIVPDVLERAEHCRRAGRWTWSEIVLVMGRRSSKSLISSIVLTWQVWRFLQLGDPQQHFGLPKAKQIILLVYGASKETARRDLFADLVERFRDSPCFAPYLHKITAA